MWFQPQVLDLNERLQEVSKLLRPLMGEDVEIVISPRMEAAIVEADPRQLDQIVLNLAVNARDAMPNGGKFILETSKVKTDEVFSQMHTPMSAGNYVMLAVSDTGVGMDPCHGIEDFRAVLYYEASGQRHGSGAGHGLCIVQQAGGHIWVYSEPRRGTTFKIYLPSAEHKLGTEVKMELAISLSILCARTRYRSFASGPDDLNHYPRLRKRSTVLVGRFKQRSTKFRLDSFQSFTSLDRFSTT